MSERIYLDHVATTPLRPEVKERMIEVMEIFGNPSSTHDFGRKSRIVVEEARRYIAKQLNCTPGEIIFTSCGTEADNFALHIPVRDLGIKHIITSPIEHHAILKPAQKLGRDGEAELHFVKLTADGSVDFEHLEELLEKYPKSVVSLMHGNNEIGNLLDLKRAAQLVKSYGAFFHSDTVQTVGHFPIDLKEIPVDMISASAHKIYGPKGIGFLFLRSNIKVEPFVIGGAQERNMRGGTENTIGIAAFHKALQLNVEKMDSEKEHILSIKNYMKQQLKTSFPEVKFNGLSGDDEHSLYTVLSVGFPGLKDDNMFLFNMDLHGIAISGGSACASGSNQGSHVIKEILPDTTYPVVRFSFGKDNTKAQVDRVIEVLKEIH